MPLSSRRSAAAQVDWRSSHIRTGAHIRMTALDRYLPKRLIMVLDVLSDIAVMSLGFIMLIVGTQYATTLGSKGFYVSLPKLSKFW